MKVFLAQVPIAPDGIAPPVDFFPYPAWMVACAAGVAALLLAGIVWLIVRWLRRKPAPPPPLPSEIALRDLEAARGQLTLDPHAFSIIVSDILRVYLTAQYGLRATRQTSPEFLASLHDFSRFTSMEKTVLAEFLEKCDLLKFARAEATSDDSAALLDQAIRFVRGGVA